MTAAIAIGLALAGLGACGGDDGAGAGDAVYPDGGGGDAGTDCYREQRDLDNGGEVEETGLAYVGARVALCGEVDADHAAGDLIDLDRFRLDVEVSGPVVARLIAPLGNQVGRIDLRVRDKGTGALLSVARVRAGHAVTAVVVPPGAYALEVEARGPSAVPIPYRIDVVPDNPETRCPAVTGTPSHTERDESTSGHRGNDMIEVRGAPDPVATVTASGADQPDPTGVAVSSGGRISIAGLSAAVTSPGDDYRDRDSFEIFTGARTNQLDLRLVWTGGGAPDLPELDLLLFEGGAVDSPMGTPVATDAPVEVAVTAVRPSTAYWLWVGNRAGAAAPASYVVHVCGRELALSTDAR